MEKKQTMKNAKSVSTGIRILYWFFAVCILLCAATIRLRYPQLLDTMQRAVFGRDRETVAAVFGRLENDNTFVETVFLYEEGKD